MLEPKHNINGGFSYQIKERKLTLSFLVPGVSPKNISADVNEDTLSISAKENDKYQYEYKVKLAGVDFDSADYSIKDGILVIHFTTNEIVKKKII